MTTTMTRREQAEAYADLYEVPMAEVYRRYGAVILPTSTNREKQKGNDGRR